MISSRIDVEGISAFEKLSWCAISFSQHPASKIRFLNEVRYCTLEWIPMLLSNKETPRASIHNQILKIPMGWKLRHDISLHFPLHTWSIIFLWHAWSTSAVESSCPIDTRAYYKERGDKLDPETWCAIEPYKGPTVYWVGRTVCHLRPTIRGWRQ